MAALSASTFPHTCSANVEDNALRLVDAGYLDRLQAAGGYVDDEIHAHYRWSIPSESKPSLRYALDLDLVTQVITCTCPAGSHGLTCKHRRLLEMKRAVVVQSRMQARIDGLEQRVADLT